MVAGGPIRAAVLGLEALLPDGRILNTLSSCPKNKTEYDIKQFYIGAEGTLGIITRVAIACMPRSSQSYTIALAVQDFQNVPNVLHLGMKNLSTSLTTFKYMDSNGIRITLRLDHIENANINIDSNVNY